MINSLPAAVFNCHLTGDYAEICMPTDFD